MLIIKTYLKLFISRVTVFYVQQTKDASICFLVAEKSMNYFTNSEEGTSILYL